MPNNTVLRIEDIGENDDAVICRTDLRPCCASLSNRHGEWYYPDGRLVPNYGAGEDFYRNRGDDGTVRLNRRNNAQQPAGVFRCEVPDRNRRLQKLTLGVVSPDCM